MANYIIGAVIVVLVALALRRVILPFYSMG